MSCTQGQSESKAPGVCASTKQGAKNHGQDRTWVQAPVWDERMLAALGNGVKGEKKTFFADMGLFTMAKTHAAASQSR